MQLPLLPDTSAWTEVDAGGVPAIWADPIGGASDRAVQYVHGGVARFARENGA